MIKCPPSRIRYAAYYRLWKTVCLNDHPQLFERANRRIDSKDTEAPSVFESYKKDNNNQYLALNAINQMIKNINARWIILSYSSGGRATSEELQDVLNNNGNLIRTVVIDYKKNVMTNILWKNEWIKEAETPNKEFLFVLEKQSQRITKTEARVFIALSEPNTLTAPIIHVQKVT